MTNPLARSEYTPAFWVWHLHSALFRVFPGPGILTFKPCLGCASKRQCEGDIFKAATVHLSGSACCTESLFIHAARETN